MKTSHFPHANTLTGTELIGVSNAGYTSYSTTTTQIQYRAHQSYVAFGPRYGTPPYAIDIGITLANYQSIAIGHYTGVFGPRSVGIGPFGYDGFNTVSVGSGVRANDGCVGMGYNIIANDPYTIAIGCNIAEIQDQTVAIGYLIRYAGTHSIGIGSQVGFYGGSASGGVAIGSLTSAHNDGGLAIGVEAEGHQRSVAIGATAAANSSYAVAIGYDAQVSGYNVYATTIGSRTTATISGTAIGYGSSSGDHAVAAGNAALAGTPYSIGIGSYNNAGSSRFIVGSFSYTPTAQDSMAIGCFGRKPFADGELAVAGTTAGTLLPTSRFQKFRTHTQAATQASVTWSSIEGWTATLTKNTPGADGNNWSLQIVYVDEPNLPINIGVSDTAIGIFLATNPSGSPTSTLNTLSLLATAIANDSDLDDFTFSYTSGFDDSQFWYILPTNLNFSGGQDTINGLFQTGALSSNAVPAVPPGTIATVYGRVTGADVNFLVGHATFSLAPTLFYTDGDGFITFINDPVFTVENGDATGLAWSVPTLTGGGSTTLSLEVPAPSNVGATIIYWVANLTFDASF